MYLITQGIGRTAIFASGFIMALLMLSNNCFDKRVAILGVLAFILMLVGDMGIALTYSIIFAIVIGIGYVFSMIWFGLCGLRLIKLVKKK
jgi:hypothetical protein